MPLFGIIITIFFVFIAMLYVSLLFDIKRFMNEKYIENEGYAWVIRIVFALIATASIMFLLALLV